MATATSPNGKAATKAKDAGGTVSSAAKSAPRPVLTAGAAAAGLVGGVALGSRLRRRKSGLQRTVETLGKAAREIGSAAHQASSATDDIRQVREELERSNRQSPVEVLLNALTHRRGMHRRER